MQQIIWKDKIWRVLWDVKARQSDEEMQDETGYKHTCERWQIKPSLDM